MMIVRIPRPNSKPPSTGSQSSSLSRFDSVKCSNGNRSQTDGTKSTLFSVAEGKDEDGDDNATVGEGGQLRADDEYERLRAEIKRLRAENEVIKHKISTFPIGEFCYCKMIATLIYNKMNHSCLDVIKLPFATEAIRTELESIKYAR